MEQLILQGEDIAKLIEAINKQNIFTCLDEEFVPGKTSLEYKNTRLFTNSFLIKLSLFLKSKSNTIEKKEFVKKVLDSSDIDHVKFWASAKDLYTARNLYLPIEHAYNNLKIIKEFPRTPQAKEAYLSIEDYAKIQIQKEYHTLNDTAKISAEKLYWDALFENSINDKGLERLEEEKIRYRAALALIPVTFSQKFPEFKLHINPIEYLLVVLKTYSEAVTTTVVN